MSGGRRVLVIDDEHTIRDVLKACLTQAGFEVFGAAHGMDGLKVLEAQPIDVVVTDILMPEMEGIETIFEIRKSYPQVRILAVSGGGRTNNFSPLQVAGKIGAHRTLAKPFELAELLAVVEELMREAAGPERPLARVAR